ncbi:hypothetical protein A2V94_06255 [Candidatus Atribacteria bacterium RBG_16_35_8]|nr:MAG: hypothetical protein A2V94_06255 [Candidatus Atribacteria bacterium RBG_16_35_8]
MKKFLLMLLIAIVTVLMILIITGCKQSAGAALTEADCIEYLNANVSDTEFGRLKTEFKTDSGLYPTVGSVVRSDLCTKQVSAVLLDSNNEIILERAYNLPPGPTGGETGYGDYNEGRTLAPGNYRFEFYYGDTLFKTIDIKIE